VKKQQRPDFRERSFGISVGTVLILIAAYLLWRDRAAFFQVPLTGHVATWVAGIGVLLVILGFTQPRLLKWPSAVWWKLAAVLGFINARVILTVAFAIVLTPVGVLWRLINHDPLAVRRKNWPGWSPSPERFRDPDHFKRMY
jgi:hypothetical protein